MKLVKLSCPNCGAKIEANNELKKAKCNFCGQEFLIDDNTIKVKHITNNYKEELENAYTYLEKLEDYDEAYNLFLGLSKKYASKPEVWLGLLRSYTEDFTYYDPKDNSKADHYFEFYIKTETSEKKKEKIEDEYNNYLNGIEENIEEIAEEKEERHENARMLFFFIYSAIFLAILILLILVEKELGY